MRCLVTVGILLVSLTLPAFADEALPALGARVEKAVALSLWNKDKVPWLDTAQHYFVAVDGKPDNPGTKDAPWDIETAFKKAGPGNVVWLRGGTYGKGDATRYTVTAAGNEQRPLIYRAYPGERATINGSIPGAGAWTYFWGLEMTNSDSVTRNISRKDRSGSLTLGARGQKAINMIIHDGGHPAIGFWLRVGDGGEVYGSICWHNGIYEPFPSGSAIYAQNKDGTRYIKDGIFFRNFTVGPKASSDGISYDDGFHYEGNVCFDNAQWNILVFTKNRENPVKRLKIINNYFYRRRNDPGKGGIQLGYYARPNDDVELRDNYIVTGNESRTFYLRFWKELSVAGNIIVGPQRLIMYDTGAEGKKSWDKNTYYGGGTIQLDNKQVSFEEWKNATGFDANSNYVQAYPDDVKVFVRPNEWEPGRGHIVIYNWPKLAAVPADISSIVPAGAAYEIRDAQNYFGKPVLQGVYDGKPVNIPMNLTEIMMPLGECPHLKDMLRHTAPEFGAFVVICKVNLTP